MSLSSSTDSPGSPISRTERERPSGEATLAELERILQSATFRESESLKRFLRYTVEHTLKGEGTQLKEYRLGVDVFERPTSFDPRTDPVVRMAARRLRAKLVEYYNGEGPNDPVWIDVPKGSYAASFSSHLHRTVTSVPEAGPPTRLWFVLAACVLVLAAISVTLRWRAVRHSSSTDSQGSSIAVLPFLNLTGTQDDEYLSDGLTDELTGALSRLPGLRVIARTSAFKFKGKADDVRSIGNQLSVTSLLEGSVQRNGEKLRVTVQLIRTEDGSHLWAETYDRKTSDSFALEDYVSEAVTRALRLRLATVQPAASRRSTNPEAHDFYLRGRYWWNRRTPDAVRKSITYFNQSLEADPLYAKAYLGLADAFTVLGFNDQAAAEDVVPKARKASEQALQLDGSLSEAHADLAAALFYREWDLRRAEQEFTLAIQLNPNYATGRQWYGVLLMCEHRFDEASAQFTRAHGLDPLSPMIVLDLGQVRYYAGHYDAAIEQAQEVLAEDPHFAMAHDLLGMAYAREGRFPEALSEFQRYVELSGRDPDALMRLAATYAASGNRKRALDLAQEMENASDGNYVAAYDVSVVYAALGDRNRAFDWLGHAIDQRSSSCLLLAIDPSFEAIRADPRFVADLRRVGLAQAVSSGGS
ncbi:MAG TPA: tetratricopeptide repeat protein [Candidatus Sulfotelmatobacter sp.]|nr:tetratricopeptide repeat protein [Candidatus Sulfotelmatobacter sp.]